MKDAELSDMRNKAAAFDDIAPELEELHEVCRNLGCPAGERYVTWAGRELKRLKDRAWATEARRRGLG